MDPSELASKLDNSEKPIFMQPGHCAGDLVEAYKWKMVVGHAKKLTRRSHNSRNSVLQHIKDKALCRMGADPTKVANAWRCALADKARSTTNKMASKALYL